MRTDACCLIIFLTVDVSRVVECVVPSFVWSPPLLILEMPVEAGERSVLLALVLEKQGALVNTKF